MYPVRTVGAAGRGRPVEGGHSLCYQPGRGRRRLALAAAAGWTLAAGGRYTCNVVMCTVHKHCIVPVFISKINSDLS